MNSYVYQLRRADSVVPFYIGKGSGERIRAHFRPSVLAKRSWKSSAIKSAMADGVEVLAEKLAEGLSEVDALKLEVELISKYGRRLDGGILTNLTTGGEGTTGVKKSLDERRAIGQRSRGTRHTAEAISKIVAAASLRGTIGQQTRDKMSAARIGRSIHTQESKARIAAVHAAKPKVQCQHCGIESLAQQIARWHGDNCKQKKEGGT